jgi:addiction module RelB/DinJ family antitoxin
MAKSSSVYTRVDPDLKEQVEQILIKLGLPMASAINLFLHQIVVHNGIPFELKLPIEPPLDISKMTKEQLDEELEKGYADYRAGKVVSASQVRENMQGKYNT